MIVTSTPPRILLLPPAVTRPATRTRLPEPPERLATIETVGAARSNDCTSTAPAVLRWPVPGVYGVAFMNQGCQPGVPAVVPSRFRTAPVSFAPKEARPGVP